MTTAPRPLRALPLLLCMALCAEISAAQAPPPLSQATEDFLSPSAARPVDDDSPPEVVRIEQIRAQLGALQAEAEAMRDQAETAKGEDLRALRSKALALRFASVAPLEELVSKVIALEEQGKDVSVYRRQLKILLPRVGPSIHSIYDTIAATGAALETELQDAAAEDRLLLESRINHQEALLDRSLGIASAHVSMLEPFELPVEAEKAWLEARLAARARLLSARIHLADLEIAETEAARADAPDDAGLAARLVRQARRHDDSVESLARTVGLMAALGMETASYKQLLIESTGEITADVFESGVAQQLLVGWMDSALEAVATNGPSVAFRTILFVLVLGIFWILARFAREVTARAVESPKLRFSQLLKRMVVSAAWAAVMLLGLLLALSQLGFEVGPMLAGLGIAGFIVGFALQDTLANFASGIMILGYRPYDVGDLIDCAGGVFGRVNQMSLVSTTILTLDNQTRVVPNGKIWGDVITNVTAQKVRRVDMMFGISYADDIAHAEQVIWSVVKEHPKILADPQPVVKVHELGDSSVNLITRPWVSRDDYWDVHWDVTREVKLRFDREGITIPFPQRDVHFHPTNGAAPVGSPGSAAEAASTKRAAQDPRETDA